MNNDYQHDDTDWEAVQGLQVAEHKAKIGFILGLVGIIAWLLPIAGFPVTITGLVFSVKGKKAVQRKGQATAGLVLNIIFLVLTSINSLLGALLSIMNQLQG